MKLDKQIHTLSNKYFSLKLFEQFGNTCQKSVRIRRYSGPHFPAFELNTERYSVSLRIQFESGKIQPRITPNRDTFYAVNHLEPNKALRGTLMKLNILIDLLSEKFQ